MRVAPGLPDPPVEVAEELRDLGLGETFYRLGRGIVPADLLHFAQHSAEDVGSHRRHRVHNRGNVEAEPVEGADHPFGVPRVVRPGGRSVAEKVDRPRVPEQRRPCVAGVASQVRPPVPGRFRHVALRLHPLQHQLVQFFFRRHVPVQRHRANAQLAGDPPHAHRLGPVRVRDGDGGGDDVGQAEPAHPARRLARVLPAPADVLGDPPLAIPFTPIAGAAR